MTPVPVVSATLTTQTVRERLTWNGWERCIEWPNERPNPGLRERLTVDPAFVVVDAAPDLTCRECGGFGDCEGCDLPGPDIHPPWRCSSCGGSGVSPVYAATWQCRHKGAIDGEWFAWESACSWPVCEGERRQLVEWRARRVEPLPVVDDEGEERTFGEEDGDYILITKQAGDHRVLRSVKGEESYRTVTDEPWADDLTLGQFVLRLSGWEHLDTPLTAMPCTKSPPWPDGCGGGCSICGGTAELPLSVPDGAVTWIELA